MFEFVRTHTRILQFVLVLLIFPSFVFFGIQGYSRFTEGANASVAKVDGHAITQGEWDVAHRNQIERMRRQMPNVDPKLLDAPEMKWRTLDNLVNQRVLNTAADKLNIGVSDERLLELMKKDPDLAGVRNADGSIDRERYLRVLAENGLSARSYESKYSLARVMGGITDSVIAPAGVTNAAVDALLQQREVQVLRFDTKDYLSKVNPSDAEVEAFYKANTAQFQAPEQASIEYVVFDVDALKKSITVPEDELRKYYAENASRYTVAEERRASHILVQAEKSAPAGDRAKAKAKAEALLAEVRKSPNAFAELAKKNSDDAGSKERGGDMTGDFFRRGSFDKPLDDAIFAMKPGEISNVVESDFGYHIIKLTAVRGGEKKPFEQVRAEIEDEVKKQLAQKKFAESAGDFSDLVYQQFDSLKPAADKFKLETRSATVQRNAAPGAGGPLASQKFLDALFGNETLRNKKNTDAIETAPTQMVAGRVVKYEPAHTLPLAEVKDRVRERLVAQQAAALARKDGEARLAQLKQAGDASALPAAVKISRAQPQGLPRAVIDAVLRADASKLPSTIGVDLADNGYALVRLNQVLPRDPATGDLATTQAQYGQAWASAESQAYFNALKARYKAEIKVAEPAASAPAQ
jgi:peptidyl-prolyl cis-trans isomerase D